MPKARLGLAQVPSGAWYHEASPVSVFDGGGGGGGAVVVVVVGGGGSVVVVVGLALAAAVAGGTYLAAVTAAGGGVVVVAAAARTTSSASETRVVHGVTAAGTRARSRCGRTATRLVRAGVVTLRDSTPPGLDSRRSGTRTRPTQSPSRIVGRHPPALFVLRSPPFL
ncbi:MAG TPA: hypothetical protein VMR97_15370, partial [Acidimicrobiales bacterium]|nr:hypothetical protein [Acidimicrobiales bacterium]